MLNIWKNSLIYLGIGLATLILLLLTTELRQMDIKSPLVYSSDAMWTLMSFKALAENEWYPFGIFENSHLSAPNSLVMGDFPVAENMLFLMAKTINIFSSDYVVIQNIYILLTFILSSVLFTYVAKKLGVNYLIGATFGIIFAFLPFHFWRLGQLFIGSYFFIPLIVPPLIWLWEKEPPFFKQKNEKLIFSIKNDKTIISLLSILLVASSGIYYSFFFAFFVIIACLSGFFANKQNRKFLISGFLLLISIVFVLIVNLLPTINYKMINGGNAEVGNRLPVEAEIYGLKLAKLILPPQNHRIELFRKTASKYYSYQPLVEGNNEYLGLIGVIGLVFLLIQSMLIRKKVAIYAKLSILSIAAIALGTIGGMGALFALLINPNIRGYNRISIIIGLFSLLALAILAQKYEHHFKKIIFYPLLAILLTIGIFDQTSATTQFSQPSKNEFYNDQQFVRTIEETIPENGKVFQLPFGPFPEVPPIFAMTDYSHFKGYLHSKNLRWSYGAVKGRPEIVWYQKTAELEPKEMINVLLAYDFNGIYIDRFGYEDRGKALETSLTAILKSEPIVSADQRLAFFPLTKKQAENSLSAAEINAIKTGNDLAVLWQDGCYEPEKNDTDNWRWCQEKATLVIENFAKENITASITMSFTSGASAKSALQMSGDLITETLEINSIPYPLQKKIIFPPGKHLIRFESEAKKLEAPNDPRHLVFQIFNFSIQP